MADPLSLPSNIGFVVSELVQIVPKSISRMEGRRVEEVAFGIKYWEANFTTSLLTKSQAPEMDAWLMQMSNPGQTFLAFDQERPRPRKHSAGPLVGGATANLVTITNSRQVTINGLPAGFQLTAGDYMSFRMSNLVRSLHMITEDATASGSGLVNLTFLHGLNTQHFTTSAVVEFEKPSCVMQVIGNPRVPKGWGARRVSFQAQEVFFQ